VLIPKENARDLKDIPDNIKGDLDIRPVAWIDEVLQVALTHMPQPLPVDTPPVPGAGESSEDGRVSRH
jgi:ATP-dependent Lon protease